MSTMEIPDELYQAIYHQEIARHINNGIDLDRARLMAREIMAHAFVSRAAQIQCESQKDYYEYEEEMSLGGETYRTR